jgi:hypothetical protein
VLVPRGKTPEKKSNYFNERIGTAKAGARWDNETRTNLAGSMVGRGSAPMSPIPASPNPRWFVANPVGAGAFGLAELHATPGNTGCRLFMRTPAAGWPVSIIELWKVISRAGCFRQKGRGVLAPCSLDAPSSIGPEHQ